MDGELEQAVELYKKSIEAFPTAEAYTFLGWTYSFMGRVDDAIAECHKAIEVDPTSEIPTTTSAPTFCRRAKLMSHSVARARLHARGMKVTVFPHEPGPRLRIEARLAPRPGSVSKGPRREPGLQGCRSRLARIRGYLN